MMTTSTPIRVLIADDHPVVREGLCGMLAGRADMVVVGEASDGEEVVQRCEELRPDVLLLDLRMPRCDGATAMERLRSRCPETRVLILTTYGSDADIDRALYAGATGYLLKDSPREELFRAIAATARGESLLAPAVAARLLRRVKGGEDAQRAGGAEPLTARELAVLQQVAAGHSNKEIAQALRIGETTVKTHLLHIFGKLEVDDRTAAVTVAVKRGLLSL